MALRNLEELAAMLARTDKQIVDLLSIRLRLAREVEEAKRGSRQAIVRLEVEDRRLAAVAEWAKENGINPHFAQAVLYLIIGESCKVQLVQLQSHEEVLAESGDEEGWYRTLKGNLLNLTEAIAPEYNEGYIRRHSALHTYLRFERMFLRKVFSSLNHRTLALDIGCANGHKALRLVRPDFGNFERVVGYDISPQMVGLAEMRARQLSLASRVNFRVQDVEEGIPETDSSVSFVLLNMGTASDIKDLKGLISEIERVLVPGGRAVLSFYNREGLLYRSGFFPWSTSLAAEIDLKRNCLSVHGPQGKIYPIYARPYTVSEVQGLFLESFDILDLRTHPTISSILPGVIFENDPVRGFISEMDEQLSREALGAYILVSVEKRQ